MWGSSSSSIRKDVLDGIVIATVAAYGFSVLLFFGMSGVRSIQSASQLGHYVRDGFILFPAAALCVGIWFAIPAGAALGMVLPRLVASAKPRRAILVGVLLSVGIGCVGGVVTSGIQHFPVLWSGAPSQWFAVWRQSLESAVALSVAIAIYSAPWLMLFCYRRAKPVGR